MLKISRKINNYVKKKNNNIARVIYLSIFIKKLVPKFKNNKIINIAVVGGKFEPELDLLKKKFIITFGIEDNDVFLDLNNSYQENLFLKKYYNSFDLIIFSQVLEHIWNHPNAFEIFKKLLKKKGYLYVTCPCSSFYHGSPDFYSPGYTSAYLDNYAKKICFKKIYSKSFGSKRLYKFYHYLKTWPTFHEYFNPFCYSLLNFRNYFKNKMHIRAILQFCNKKFNDDKNYNTETIGIYQK